MSNFEEYIEKIRTRAGLKNAILAGIIVKKSLMTAEFVIITDKAYTIADEAFALETTKEHSTSPFQVKVRIVKRVPDQELITDRILAYMQEKFPAASSFLERKDIQVDMKESGANFWFDIASGEQELFTSANILDSVSAYLGSVYCGSFYGNVRIVEKQIDTNLEDYEVVEEETTQSARFFEITEFEKFDGVETVPPKYAWYIADATSVPSEDMTVCGAITYVQEKETKNGKTYFQFVISDGTGNMRVSYFPRKANLEKVKELKAGDYVVCSGANEEYNGNISYKAQKINFGRPPKDFVPEKLKGNPVPNAYHTVFPEPYSDYTQSGFFDNQSIPDDLKNNTFVVFDLETTGLNNNPTMGKMDKIIELGAAKIKDGSIVEKFSSFISCSERLNEKIVELTGIHDEDLVGAPDVDKVLADFFKFTDGCYLVGHNVQFDYKFVKYYAEQKRYMFENRDFDTMYLAQELLAGQLTNYKLDTLATYYGITFNHHRAFDDALTTAKIFIELIKTRGKLPI